MFVLDTCVCVDFLRGNLKLGYQRMRSGRPGDFKLSAIAAAELYYGVAHSADPEKNKAAVDSFLSTIEVLPFETEAACAYAQIRQTLGMKGQLIGDRDMMIAATALANDAVLVTNNVREFKRIPNLVTESWYETDL